METRAQNRSNLSSNLDQSAPDQLGVDEPTGVVSLPFFENDCPRAFVAAARKHQSVAWDIETSGLDWKSQRIGICQLLVKEHGLSIVKIKKNRKPPNLAAILQDRSIQKVFHHAMFDLRFLCYHWGVTAENIACTKIASKLLDPDKTKGHTLAELVQQYLGVSLDKTSRKSDWLTWGLSPDQLKYAGNDVKYLPALLETLLTELEKKNRRTLAIRCFAHIPVQVQLEIQGFRDIYGY